MRRAALLLVLLLLAPALAQETDPNIEFVTNVMRCVLTGDGPGAARLIKADKPRALESFGLLVNGYPMIKDPKQQAMMKGYVNTVARVFEADGDPSLVQRLKAEGLLVEQPPPPPPPPQSSTNALDDLIGKPSASVAQYRVLFAEGDKNHQTATQQAVQTMNIQVVPVLRQKDLDIASAPLTYSLLDGDMARVEGRLHQVTARLLMAETGGNLTDSQLATLKQELAAAEIYGLKLDGVRLVTLSACQTALGEREPGSELQTLADAFGVAGTNSVVASYWSVADESTKALMIEFYKQLKAGRPLAQALNGAQLTLLKNPQFNHPFFWAPFVLIGDWR